MIPTGILIGLGLLAGVGLGPASIPAGLAVLLLGWILHGGRLRVVLTIYAIASLGGVMASMRAEPLVASEALEASEAAIVTVDSIPVAGGQNERAVLRIVELEAGDGTFRPARGRVLAFFPPSARDISKGDRLFVAWKAEPLDRLPPGYATYVTSHNATGSAHVFAISRQETGPRLWRWIAHARRDINDRLAALLLGDTGALATGIVTGDDAGLDDRAREAFQRTGTAHITAVSGQNVVLLFSLVTVFWVRLGRRRWRIAFDLTAITLLLAYLLLVGLEPAAIRATAVAITGMGAKAIGRRPDAQTILALVLGAMATVNPRMVDSAGFWLSASASWGLCATLPEVRPRGFRNMLLALVRSSIVASVATLPIVLGTFHSWSIVTPIANVMISPLMGIAFPFTFVLVPLLYLPGPWAEWWSTIPAAFLHATLEMVERLGRHAPIATVRFESVSAFVIVLVPCLLGIWIVGSDGRRWAAMLERRVAPARNTRKSRHLRQHP